MKPNEEYWLNLYKKGLIEVDPETGFVCSWLSNSKDGRKKKNKKQIGASNRSKDNWYIHLSAGPSRKERYQILAHRFVWIIFNGDIPDRLEINHINGIKNDNRLCNLELVTKSQNELHKHMVLHKRGGISYGENSGTSKLTWDDVLEIRWLWNEGVRNYSSIGREFGIVRTQVKNIVTNISWNRENIEEMKK